MDENYNKIMNMSEEEAMRYLEELNACDHDCSHCSANCSGSDNSNLTPKLAKHIIAVYSGKGGVGTSAVTVQLASAFVKLGLKTAILDANLAGSSIAHMLGVTETAGNDGEKIFPLVSSGIEFVSMASISPEPEEPIIYPSDQLASMAGFFYIGTNWNSELDIMLVDMPSGSSDIVLDFFTTIPFDGAVIVTEPGRLAVTSVRRAMNLCSMLMIPVIGLVENFSTDPQQQHITELYGDTPLLAAVPRSEHIFAAASEGSLATVDTSLFDGLAAAIAENIG